MPPLDKKGLPIVNANLATSFLAIESMFTSSAIAKYAYVHMAQPLKLNTPWHASAQIINLQL